MTSNLVKLTDARGETRGGTRWQLGQPVSIPEPERRADLCGPGLLHAYRSIEQALLLDPMHGAYTSADTARMYAARAPAIVADDGAKIGVHALTPTAELERPAWWEDSATRRRVQVRFAALCVRAAYAVDAATTAPTTSVAAAYYAVDDAAAAGRPLDTAALAAEAVALETSAPATP